MARQSLDEIFKGSSMGGSSDQSNVVMGKKPLEDIFKPTDVSSDMIIRTEAPTGEIKKKSWFDRVSDMAQGVQDFAVGAAKGFANTIVSSQDLISQGLDKIAAPIVKATTGKEDQFQGSGSLKTVVPEEAYTPQNNTEKAGFYTEQILEFFIPGGASTKAIKAVDKSIDALNVGSKVVKGGMKLLNKAGTEAAVMAGQTASQGGSMDDVKANALIAGGIPVVGKIVKTATDPLKKWLSTKIAPELVNKFILKPSVKEFHFGKNPGKGVVDEGLKAASPERMLEKIISKKKALGVEIDNKLITEGKGKIVDLRPALKRIDDEITKAASSGEQALVSRLTAIKEGLTRNFRLIDGKVVATGSRPLSVKPSTAAKIKRKIGNATKWTGQAFDNEANRVRVEVYRAINDAIEQVVPGTKVLNGRYANLLSAEKSLDHAINLAQRRYPLGLIDTGVGAAAAVASAATGDTSPEALAKGLIAAGLYKGAKSTAAISLISSVLAKLSPEQKTVVAKAIPLLRNVFASLGIDREEATEETATTEKKSLEEIFGR